MNCSIYSADRATHLRIVVVALVAAISIVGLNVGRSYRGDFNAAPPPAAAIVKAGKAMVLTSSDVATLR